jgi:hypothetical protein
MEDVIAFSEGRPALELPPPFQDRAPRRHRIAVFVLAAAMALAFGFVFAVV